MRCKDKVVVVGGGGRSRPSVPRSPAAQETQQQKPPEHAGGKTVALNLRSGFAPQHFELIPIVALLSSYNGSFPARCHVGLHGADAHGPAHPGASASDAPPSSAAGPSRTARHRDARPHIHQPPGRGARCPLHQHRPAAAEGAWPDEGGGGGGERDGLRLSHLHARPGRRQLDAPVGLKADASCAACSFFPGGS